MRVEQKKNKLTYRWAREARAARRSRSAHPIDLSVRCGRPEPGQELALVLPACNSEAMQLHLDEDRD